MASATGELPLPPLMRRSFEHSFGEFSHVRPTGFRPGALNRLVQMPSPEVLFLFLTSASSSAGHRLLGHEHSRRTADGFSSLGSSGRPSVRTGGLNAVCCSTLPESDRQMTLRSELVQVVQFPGWAVQR